MATPAYAQLTHGLRVPYAKKHYHFNEGRTEKKNMPFILLLSIIEIEIAFIHISLTQLTRKHTPQFCLRILTRLKVLLTQPFDMSNPFRKQSTGVLNAALCCSCCSFHFRSPSLQRPRPRRRHGDVARSVDGPWLVPSS